MGIPSEVMAIFDSLFSFFLVKEDKNFLIVYFPFLSCEIKQNNQVKSRARISYTHWPALAQAEITFLINTVLLQRPWPTHKEMTYSFNTALHLAASSVGTGTKLPPQPTQRSPPTASTTRQEEMTSLVSLFHLAASTAGIGMQNKLPPLSVQYSILQFPQTDQEEKGTEKISCSFQHQMPEQEGEKRRRGDPFIQQPWFILQLLPPELVQ